MADHPKLAVLKALTTLLEGITTDDGFTYDLADKIVRGRSEFGDNDDPPLVSIIEAPRSDTGAIFAGGGEVRHEQWDLLVQGWAEDDVKNPTDPLYPLLADVEARIAEVLAPGNANYMLPDDDGNPRLTGMTVFPSVVRPPSVTPAAKACFYLPLRVGLALSVG